MTKESVSYADEARNTYRIEQASNGMYICVRTNKGGNRKGVKSIGASRNLGFIQKRLEDMAENQGWSET